MKIDGLNWFLPCTSTETECQIRDIEDVQFRRIPCLFLFSVEMDVIRGKEYYIVRVFPSGKLAFPTPNNALTNFTRLALYISIATGNRSNPNRSLTPSLSADFKMLPKSDFINRSGLVGFRAH